MQVVDVVVASLEVLGVPSLARLAGLEGLRALNLIAAFGAVALERVSASDSEWAISARYLSDAAKIFLARCQNGTSARSETRKRAPQREPEWDPWKLNQTKAHRH